MLMLETFGVSMPVSFNMVGAGDDKADCFFLEITDALVDND